MNLETMIAGVEAMSFATIENRDDVLRDHGKLFGPSSDFNTDKRTIEDRQDGRDGRSMARTDTTAVL